MSIARPIRASRDIWFTQQYDAPRPLEHPPAYRIAMMDLSTEGRKEDCEVDWRYTRCEAYFVRWAVKQGLSLEEMADMLHRSDTETLLIWLDMRTRGEFGLHDKRGRPKAVEL